jgi:hypothetical protein
MKNTFCSHAGLDPESSIFYDFLDSRTCALAPPRVTFRSSGGQGIRGNDKNMQILTFYETINFGSILFSFGRKSTRIWSTPFTNIVALGWPLR